MRFLLCLLFLVFFCACRSTIHTGDPPRSTLPTGFKRNINQSSSFVATSSRPCDLTRGSAVVIMYHKFNEPYESTSVTVDQFKEHLRFFKDNGYKVVTLGKIVSAIKGNIPFGEKWVAITIDDAYKSFLLAQPILEQYEYPYTIFVNTEAVDNKYPSSMTWEDLKNIVRSGLGELAAHSHTHGHLVQDMGTEQRQNDILFSVERIYKNTSIMPRFFSYPFGEVSNRLIQELKTSSQILGRSFSFSAAFSTQSGPAGCSSDLFTIPRFAINKKYGVVDSQFEIKMNSRHLPVYDYHPKNKAVCVEQNIKDIYFSTLKDIDLRNIRCYASRGNKAQVIVSEDGLVRVSLNRPLGFGLSNPYDIRERVNCTAHYKGRYFWYGREFTILKNSPECSN